MADPKSGNATAAEAFRGCWFVTSDGNRVETYTGGQIIAATRGGQLSVEAMVTCEGMSGWQRIADVPALAAATQLLADWREESALHARPVVLDALPQLVESPATEEDVANDDDANHDISPATNDGTSGTLSLTMRARKYLSVLFASGLYLALQLL